MEKTTILISKELANRLAKLKYHYGFKTMEEVIRHYIKEVALDDIQNKKAMEKDNDEESLSGSDS